MTFNVHWFAGTFRRVRWCELLGTVTSACQYWFANALRTYFLSRERTLPFSRLYGGFTHGCVIAKNGSTAPVTYLQPALRTTRLSVSDRKVRLRFPCLLPPPHTHTRLWPILYPFAYLAARPSSPAFSSPTAHFYATLPLAGVLCANRLPRRTQTRCASNRLAGGNQATGGAAWCDRKGRAAKNSNNMP